MSEASERYDLLILGGGAAGLVLARELARREATGLPIPRTVVLEAREAYADDRTWCSFRPVGGGSPDASCQWSHWRFSGAGRAIEHAAAGWSYERVRAEDVYRAAVTAIEASHGVDQRLGTPVETVTRSEEDGIWRARGGERSWSAREVIDCRPPSAERLARATLQQVFIGVEVECEAPLGRGRPVGLMEHLRATAEAVCFDYVLPLSEHRLLVEATRFARPGWQWDDLEADLAGALQRAGVRASDPVLRSERGVIPMGLPSGPSHPAQGWTVAGTAGGAVRAATGYAFAGIEDWAAACAVALGEGGNALPARSGSPFQRTMDGLFLRALRREPWRGPGWFLALAERVEPTRLTRFLAGKPRAADWWAVVRALPAGPMLAACRAPTAPRKGEVTA